MTVSEGFEMWYSRCMLVLPALVVLLAQRVLLLEDDSPARLGRVLLLSRRILLLGAAAACAVLLSKLDTFIDTVLSDRSIQFPSYSRVTLEKSCGGCLGSNASGRT
jgi:hypothetical protein